MTIYFAIIFGFIGITFLFLLLYRLRSKFGFTPLFMLLGSMLYFQAQNAQLLNTNLGDSISIYSVNSIIAVCILTVILLFYVKEGIAQTKTVLLGVFIASTMMSLIVFFTAANQNSTTEVKSLFIIYLKPFICNIMLLVAGLLLIIFYQKLINSVKKPSLLVLFCSSILMATIGYTLLYNLSFNYNATDFKRQLIYQLTNTSFLAISAGVILHLYLKYFEQDSDALKLNIKRNVFSILAIKNTENDLDIVVGDFDAKSNVLLETTLNNISDGFVTLDKNWRFTYANVKTGEFLNQNPKSLIGKEIWNVFPDNKDLSFSKLYHKAVMSQKEQFYEGYYEKLDKWFENRVYPTKDGVTIYFRDITKRVKSEGHGQMLNSLINSSDQFIGLATLEGKPFYLNRNGRALVGLTEQDNLPATIYNFYPSNYKKEVKNVQLAEVYKKESWRGETYFINLKTKELIPVEVSRFLIRDEQSNKPIALGIVANDITSRKISENKILDFQHKMQAAIRIGNIGHWSWDMSTDEVYWSDVMYNIYDVDKDTVVEYNTASNCVHPEDKKYYNETSAQRIENKSNKPFEFRILAKNGTVKYVMVQMEVIEDASGVPIKFHGTVIDVTERKHAEEKLENSELLFRELTSSAPVGIFRMELDGSCSYVNSQWQIYAGMSFNDAMEFGWTNAIHPDDRERVFKSWMEIVPTGKDFNVEFRFLNPDGKILWMTVKAVGNYNADKKLYGYTGICLDVTEIKVAQQNLIKSEKLFKRLTSKAPVGIFQTTKEGLCNYANKQWLQSAGLTYEEAMGDGWATALHPDDLNRIAEEWQNYIESNKTELETSFRFLHKNKEVIWVTVKTVATFDADNRLNGYIGMTIDITDKKIAEEKLINSELLFRGLTNNAPVGIFKTDKDGACNFVNNEWINYAGISYEEAMGFGWSNALHPENKSYIIDHWQDCVANNKEYNVDLTFFNKKKNKTYWLSVRSEGLYDLNNNLIGFVGICLDITERKKAEEQLKENERYLENILNNIGDPIFVKDDQSRIILANEALSTFFNIKKEDILGKTLAEKFPADARNRLLNNDQNILKTGLVNIQEETLNLNNIETRTFITKKTRFIDSKEKKYIIGVVRDITERKETELKIADMQHKIESAIRIGNIGYWSWEIETDEVFWSDLMYDIFELERNTILNYNTVLNCVHPEDKDYYDKTTKNRITNKSNKPIDFRILCKNNIVKYITAQTEVILDDQGNAIKFQGTVLDITEKKVAEIELINNEKLFKGLISNSPIVIYQTDKNGACNYINEKWYHLTGQTINEALGYGFANAIHPEDRDRVINKWNNAVKNQENFKTVFRHLKPNGTVIWFSNKAVKTYDANNKFSGYIGTILNITDAKKAEEIEQKSKQYLNDILNNIGDPVFVKDNQSKLILVNDALCNTFGLQREQIIGKTLGEKIPAKEYETLLKIENHILQTGEEVVNEETVSLNNKPTRTFSVKKTRYIDNDSNKLIVGVLRDITERKKVEEEIRKAHQRLTTHLNNSPLAIIEWDTEFHITSWSTKATKIFGWTEAEVNGKKVSDIRFVYEEDESLINKYYLELKNAEVNFNRIINRNYTKDNKVIYCEWYNSALLDAEGKIESFLSMVQDVTERVEIEKSIKESEEKFSKVFHSSLIGYSIINTDEVRIDVNEALAKILETTREHLIGKTMEGAQIELIDDAYYQQKNRLLDKLLKNGYLHNESINRTLNSGKKINLLTSVEPIEISGETHALFAVIDNTENKITELELENYRNNLEELVNIRTSEVDSKNKELERMNKLFIGRELKMRDLKNVIKDLRKKYEQ
ncbi:PAS domain S-box protein [Winogradskyella endarachnes]|uniref:histidine kinase n=1 Tax=Winogradskyella endarachnes TaxID=2681965 RepID=A0A6L6U798_9FLAO|nr:PAS domain S-box protein [Winogradskyella endarachnes]MUU77486.1 PAS domain S-box protein [Winogradskyella endarachnes]